MFHANNLDIEKSIGSAKRLDHTNANSVAVSPDGKWVVTGTFHGFGVKVWDARSGKPALPDALLPQERVTTVTFSPDNAWLVTGTFAAH